MHPAHPFDAEVVDYDERFSHTRLGHLLRRAVHRHLDGFVQAGDRVLELGCGTGEDALWLAGLGARVIATDASRGMLRIAAAKTEAAGLAERISFSELDLRRIQDARYEGPDRGFDAVLANFGVLNCLPERRAVAERLAEWLRPGGRAAMVLMSPVCPWEIAWHLARGRVRTATRRLRPNAVARLASGATVPVWYPSPDSLHREFAPGFAHVETIGVGSLLPPSDLPGPVDRWPRLFERVATWDERMGRRWPWPWLCDHYLAIYERR